jgi:hypothetical protein
MHDGKGETAIDAPAIDNNGAGAALAMVASLLAAGQMKMIAQGIEKRGSGIKRQIMTGAVDAQVEVRGWHRCVDDIGNSGFGIGLASQWTDRQNRGRCDTRLENFSAGNAAPTEILVFHSELLQ